MAAAATEDDTSRLFRVRRTLMEMLHDRGYAVADEDLAMDKLQFIDKFGDSVKRDDLFIKTAKRDNPKDQIFVFFPNDAKVGIKNLRPCVDQMRQENVTRAIVVVNQSVTPASAAFVQEMLSKTIKLEIFLEAELLVNITQHELVPEHCPLTNDEKNELLERYTLKETQLPRILVTDPVARYHGLRRGQVVKITRKSDTTGEYTTYRFVV